MQNGAITSSVLNGKGGGGDIIISKPTFIILNNSEISARADYGNGGNMLLEAEQIIRDPSSIISASSNMGIDGAVYINAAETDISGTLTLLPESYLRAGTLLRDRCVGRIRENSSRLVHTGTGKVSAAPDEYFLTVFAKTSEQKAE